VLPFAVRALPEVVLWSLIALLAIVNLAVYTSVVRGEDAINVQTAPTTGTPQSSTLSPSQRAELDDSDSLPGRFVPTQGRAHTTAYPLPIRVPFCPEHQVSNQCYASNPPSSGLHLPVQGTAVLADGNRLKIPPDPGVYDVEVPREAIPHIEEHAGVYVGYHCASNDCRRTAERLIDLVSQEISLGSRVVVSPDGDLPDDTIGIASWTRVDTFPSAEYSDGRVRDFIKAHSCRFDPEGFCRQTPVN
jgi:hypothetical protein